MVDRKLQLFIWNDIVSSANSCVYKIFSGWEDYKITFVTDHTDHYNGTGGGSQENTGCIVILILIFMTYLSCKKYQKKADAWMYIGIVASILGYLSLVLAPGNYVRLDEISNANIFIRLIKNVIVATKVYFENCIFLFELLAVVVVFMILGYKNKFIDKESYKHSVIKTCIFMACSVISMYILIAAYIATRAMVCPVVMILIAILGVANMMYDRISEIKVLITVMAILLIPCSGIEFRKAYNDILTMTEWWNSIESHINEEKERGNRDIVIENYIIPKTKYTPYQSEYLNEDTEKGPNIYICHYYDIDSIVMKKYDVS